MSLNWFVCLTLMCWMSAQRIMWRDLVFAERHPSKSRPLCILYNLSLTNYSLTCRSSDALMIWPCLSWCHLLCRWWWWWWWCFCCCCCCWWQTPGDMERCRDAWVDFKEMAALHCTQDDGKTNACRQMRMKELFLLIDIDPKVYIHCTVPSVAEKETCHSSPSRISVVKHHVLNLIVRDQTDFTPRSECHGLNSHLCRLDQRSLAALTDIFFLAHVSLEGRS